MQHESRRKRAQRRRLQRDVEPIESALLFGALVGAALASLPLIILFALPSNVYSADAWQEAPVVAAGPVLLATAITLFAGAIVSAVFRNAWAHFTLRRSQASRARDHNR